MLLRLLLLEKVNHNRGKYDSCCYRCFTDCFLYAVMVVIVSDNGSDTSNDDDGNYH